MKPAWAKMQAAANQKEPQIRERTPCAHTYGPPTDKLAHCFPQRLSPSSRISARPVLTWRENCPRTSPQPLPALLTSVFAPPRLNANAGFQGGKANDGERDGCCRGPGMNSRHAQESIESLTFASDVQISQPLVWCLPHRLRQGCAQGHKRPSTVPCCLRSR